MEGKKNIIMGVIGAIVLVAALVGLKYYQEGRAPEGVAADQPQQQVPAQNNNDPYGSYSAPAPQPQDK
jgi:hypothetical protein